MQQGLLLINLGTPKSTKTKDIRNYLHEFLLDKRVINLPYLLRSLLVNVLILPFRAHKSSSAYQTIWTPEGSPLLYLSQQLTHLLQKKLGSEYTVALGMRYGEPSIASALKKLKDCHSITILPLYPQYASASTGSAIEKTLKLIATQEVIPSFKVINEFYQNPLYIKAQSNLIKEHLQKDHHLILSYHGIPENQILRSGCKTVCATHCPEISHANLACYKAQCYQTSRLIAQELDLNLTAFTTTFQSRLGKTRWIKPYTDEILPLLLAKGIKKITISCPSFVVDCLETLEEIGVKAKEQWRHLGGEQLTLIPSLNTHPEWINTLFALIEAPRQ